MAGLGAASPRSRTGGSKSAACRADPRNRGRTWANGASHAVPFVRLQHLAGPVGRAGCDHCDLTRFVDFHTRDADPSRGDGLDGSRHVLLAKMWTGSAPWQLPGNPLIDDGRHYGPPISFRA